VGTNEDLVYKEYEKMVDIEMLKKYIDSLGERDKQIMVMRYGLDKSREYTQKEVANILGISQSYISRIEKKVIKKLKNVLD
jgi:RNA polymerase sporulation-specific sigma factor